MNQKPAVHRGFPLILFRIIFGCLPVEASLGTKNSSFPKIAPPSHQTGYIRFYLDVFDDVAAADDEELTAGW